MGGRSRLKIVVKIACSVVLLALVVRSVDLAEVYRTLRHSSLIVWPLILAALFADRVLMAYKWNLLLRARGVRLGLRSVVEIYFIGTFVGFFLPATIGNDLSRLHSLSRSGASVVESASSIVTERLVGFLTLAGVGILGLAASVYFYELALTRLILAVLAFLVLILAGLAVLIGTDWVGRVLRAIGRRQRWRIWEHLHRLYLSLKDFSTTLHVLPRVTFWTLAEHVLMIVITYLLAVCLRIETSIVYFFMFIPAMMLIERIPISFNGLGVREGLFVVFFSQVGLTASQGFTISIASQMLYVVSMIPGLYLVLFGTRWSRSGVPAGPTGGETPASPDSPVQG